MENIFEAKKSFNDIFDNMHEGDTLLIVGTSTTHWGEIIDIKGGDVGIEILGSDYIIHSNSLDDDGVFTLYTAKEKNPVKIHNVEKLLLKREGNNIGELSLNPDDNNDEEENTNKVILPFYKEAYNEIMTEIGYVGENSKLIVRTGQLNGADEIEPSTMTELSFDIVEIFEDDTMRIKLDSVRGSENYDELEKVFIKLSPTKSFSIDQNGIKMEVITMKKPFKHVIISDVYDIEVKQNDGTKYSPNIDDLKQRKEFRDMYNKDPNFFQELMGKGAVGVYQINKLMDKYSLSKSYNTKNAKVKFLFNGKNIASGTKINLINNQVYEGRFSTPRTIKLVNSGERNTNITIKLEEEVKTNIYTATVYKNQIINGQPKTTRIGECTIKILDKNYK